MTVDLTIIINKLKKAHKTESTTYGMKGVFSIKNDSYLLTPEELELWLECLHDSSSPHDKKCRDIHAWQLEGIH